MHSDSLLCAGELIDTGYLAEKFLIEGTRPLGVRKSHKDAHVAFEDAILRDKVHALARGVEGGQDFVEVLEGGLRRTHTNHARDFGADLAPTFFTGGTHHKSSSVMRRMMPFRLVSLQDHRRALGWCQVPSRARLRKSVAVRCYPAWCGE